MTIPVTVAWSALLSINGTEWHEALDTAVVDSTSSGISVMEVPTDQALPAISLVSYMAVNHEQVVARRHLETLLAALPSPRVVVLVACGRVPKGGKKVTIEDVRNLLNDQGPNFGSERMAYRFSSAQELSDEARKLITQNFTRQNPPVSYVPATIGLGPVSISPAWRAESGLN